MTIVLTFLGPSTARVLTEGDSSITKHSCPSPQDEKIAIAFSSDTKRSPKLF